ncbi:MAG: nitroreductase family deazaflavin-dependent oxidoreductase [Dehalococcoidia bacterium]|nr:nitroreductase family deazaflavin-dependent oxidoreductase [Dehalococcoidia bacterium]MYD28251.1 nitroreductase family deazaflavin-dependent oxidoreductase [Dehalococcoidia bacterium]
MFQLQMFFLRLFAPFHTFVFRLTRGWLMGKFGLPVLLLTTTGARTGRQQTSPLLYVEEDGALLIPASLWGGPRNPAWYYNCVANPEVVVETRGKKRTMLAEPAPEEDRQRLYDLFKAGSGHYAGHEARTDRKIPVVILRELEG